MIYARFTVPMAQHKHNTICLPVTYFFPLLIFISGHPRFLAGADNEAFLTGGQPAGRPEAGRILAVSDPIFGSNPFKKLAKTEDPGQ